jgi:Divergent InlB B-repeat domain/IPT/TIG domain
MKIINKFPVVVVLAAFIWAGLVRAQASELLFSQLSDGQSAYGPSELWTPAGVNSEVADDFNIVGNIDRVSASGFIWGNVNFQGVYVRFYQYGADGKPGALQRQYFLNTGFNAGAIDVPLSPPFTATGRHFLSVQPVINYWYWWSANNGVPRGQAFYFRNNATGEAWHHGDNLNLAANVNADVVFDLYGTATGPGVISSLSASTLPRSGFLEIVGSNFGGDGTVLIGGIKAAVADWTSTRIIAYVPETAPLATLPVQVVNGAGGSNTIALTVTTRPAAANHVNWRFRMNGPYSEVRAAVGPDKTVYAIDAFFHLYALAPDGGLKWLVRGAGDKGVAVGPDGTIYVASESYIKAFNPDGSAKWTFVQNPRAFICLGVSVGPDGNIYSVGTQGMGVFSLTPQGALRWTNFEGYARLIVDYAEIVFGSNGGQQQLYFYANDHLRSLRLDGASVFTIPGNIDYLRPGPQPAVAPDGSVHNAITAYSPNGAFLWSFASPYPYNVFTQPDIGSDGIHYFVQNLSQLFALNANGSQRWHATVNGYVAGPIVDSLNTQLIMGSDDTGDHAGFILSASAKDGHELWRVTLPAEDPTVFNSALGIFGFNQFVTARARFTADGQTAYVMTATATGDNNTSRSFVYSLASGNGTATPTPTPTPAPTVQVTVQTNPTGRAFSVDGTSYTSTQTFTWVSSSSHTIATTSPQSGGTGVRYVWTRWGDSGAMSHTVAPTTNKTYTATFRKQFYLTMSHGAGGTVGPTSGWRNSGAAISISAVPANGYSFTNWRGSGTGSYSGTNNPASITMGGPITEAATFTHN